MKQVHILVTGFVQGVGYRKFVRHIAREEGITGWVRNNPDGSVEALAVGEEEALESLIAACKKGPMLSSVDNVDVQWDDMQQTFEAFVIFHG